MRRHISCPGTMYSGRTLVIFRPADKDYYEGASAVCDWCGYRLTLDGRRLPRHRLDVTIHGLGE
jgi:hypothetical protein